MATDVIGVLTAALDEAVAVDPTVLGDGEAVVALHRQLERLTASAYGNRASRPSPESARPVARNVVQGRADFRS